MLKGEGHFQIIRNKKIYSDIDEMHYTYIKINLNFGMEIINHDFTLLFFPFDTVNKTVFIINLLFINRTEKQKTKFYNCQKIIINEILYCRNY